MAVEFKDYYKILGVSASASLDDIKRTYRKLARKYHPDLNKTSGSEARLKEINEAYEVLQDPEKRKKYDQMSKHRQRHDRRSSRTGSNRAYGFNSRSQGQQAFYFRDSNDDDNYSDFFESLFGDPLRDGKRRFYGHRQFNSQRKGTDHEAVLSIPLKEAFTGTTKNITLHAEDSRLDSEVKDKRYEVKIPPGILAGQKIRLQGKGGQGQRGGNSGDLYLEIEIEPHPTFQLDGRDLITELAITPWEAALGAKIDLPLLSGSVTLSIPAGTQNGQKLRLTGKGMPNPRGRSGDFYAQIRISIPKKLSKKEKKLFEQLRKISPFNPRK